MHILVDPILAFHEIIFFNINWRHLGRDAGTGNNTTCPAQARPVSWTDNGHSFTPPWVATLAGLAPLRHSSLTLLLSRVGLMRLEIINLMLGAVSGFSVRDSGLLGQRTLRHFNYAPQIYISYEICGAQ